MKIVFVCKDREDPATRYRVLPLAEYLERTGADVLVCDEVGGLMEKWRMSSATRGADVVFVQRRLLSPFWVKRIRRGCRVLCYDFDDAVFCRSSGAPSRQRQKKFRAIVNAADLVFAGNNYLRERAGKGFTIPTPVDETRYQVAASREEKTTLVWIGSSSTAKYLEQARVMLEEVGKTLPEVCLKVVADFEFQLDHMTVNNVPWSSQTEAMELTSAHIGIAPMTDNPWTRGKCALKIIQFMAASLPVVSSRVGANAEVVAHGETGFLAETGQEWVSALSRLAGDEALRIKLGTAGRERMIAHYSESSVVARLSGLLTEAVSSGRLH